MIAVLEDGKWKIIPATSENKTLIQKSCREREKPEPAPYTDELDQLLKTASTPPREDIILCTMAYYHINEW